MDRFHKIPDASAIILKNRIHKQVDLYQRGKRVYAQHGAGYALLIKVVNNVRTSVPDTIVEDFTLDGAKFKWTKVGYLELV